MLHFHYIYFDLFHYPQACCNINLTTKKIHAIKEENSHLFLKNKLEYNEEMVVNQVVAVDLKQVSDIILPSQVCIFLAHEFFLGHYKQPA